jgi:enolase
MTPEETIIRDFSYPIKTGSDAVDLIIQARKSANQELAEELASAFDKARKGEK